MQFFTKGNTPRVGNIGQWYMKRWSQCVLVKLCRKSLSKQPLVGSQVIRNRRYKDPGIGPLLPVTEARNRYRTMQAERRRLEAS